MVELSSREFSLRQEKSASALSFCDFGDAQEIQKVGEKFQDRRTEQPTALPKLDLLSQNENQSQRNSKPGMDSSLQGGADSNKACLKLKDKPVPGSAEAVAQKAESSKHAQYWKNDPATRERTEDGLFACALQASEVMFRAGAIPRKVFGVGQLIDLARKNGWTEVRDGSPIKPGDLVIGYHPENPNSEGMRHATIASAPNEKGETMVWNNTNRTRLVDEEDRSKRWDKERLSDVPYPAFKIYRAPERKPS